MDNGSARAANSRAQGFALLVVLWVVAILSALSLALVASSRVEARNAAVEWDRLVAQRLARSGQELALYLQFKGLGLPNEDLSGLPIDVRIHGFRYALRFPEGSVELFLETDIGKINPATADAQLLQNFFTLWTGDAGSGMLITEAIKDWCDLDSEVRPGGAEAGFYSSLGYTPRNAGLGVADLPLIRGISSGDFYPKVINNSSGATIREGLSEFVTPIATGTRVNPNFAPKLILLSVPGLTSAQVESLLLARKEGLFFGNADQFKSRIALPADSPVWQYFQFDRGTAPTVLTVARDGSGKAQHSERHVFEILMGRNAFTGNYEYQLRMHHIELDRTPEFLRN